MATKAPFTEKELEEFRTRLQEERAELETQLTTIEESSFATPQSDLSGEVAFHEEYADAGTFPFERERDLSIENNVRDLMGKIDAGDKLLAEDLLFICLRCVKPIEKAR